MGSSDDKNVAGRLLDTLFCGNGLEFHSYLRRVRDDPECRSVTVDALLLLDRTGGPEIRVKVSQVFGFICAYCPSDIHIENALTILFRHHYTPDVVNRLHEDQISKKFSSEHDILLNLLSVFTHLSYKAAHEVCDSAAIIFKGTPFEERILKKRARIK
jgi:hypothetical protein